MITEEPGEELLFTSVTQGPHGSYDFEEEYFVIDNQDDFEAFWEALYEGRGSTPSLPSVDFSEETIGAALFGTKTKGGYAIEVTEVTSDGDRLHVQVEKNRTRRRLHDHAGRHLPVPRHQGAGCWR